MCVRSVCLPKARLAGVAEEFLLMAKPLEFNDFVDDRTGKIFPAIFLPYFGSYLPMSWKESRNYGPFSGVLCQFQANSQSWQLVTDGGHQESSINTRLVTPSRILAHLLSLSRSRKAGEGSLPARCSVRADAR